MTPGTADVMGAGPRVPTVTGPALGPGMRLSGSAGTAHTGHIRSLQVKVHHASPKNDTGRADRGGNWFPELGGDEEAEDGGRRLHVLRPR